MKTETERTRLFEATLIKAIVDALDKEITSAENELASFPPEYMKDPELRNGFTAMALELEIARSIREDWLNTKSLVEKLIGAQFGQQQKKSMGFVDFDALPKAA